MSATSKMVFCRQCGRDVVPKKAPVQHGLHLSLSILTLGCWLPIWLLLWVVPFQKVCRECGQPVGKNACKGAEDPPTTSKPKGNRRRAA